MKAVLNIKEISNVGILNIQNEISIGKLNLFYGYNGSGKTTLSRLFYFLGLDDVDANEKEDVYRKICNNYEEGLKLNINGEGNNDINDINDIKKYHNKIYVFNKDFIDRNIKSHGVNEITITEKSGEYHTLLRGVRDLQEKISEKEEYYTEKSDNNINKLKDEVSIKKKEIDDCLINYGRHIKAIGGAFTNYHKNSFDIEKVESELEKIKKDTDYPEGCNKDNVKDEVEKAINDCKSKEEISLEHLNKVIKKVNSVNTIIEEINPTLSEQIELQDDDIKNELDGLGDDIKDWIKIGRELHNTHHNKEDCLFCHNPLNDRLKKLNNAISDKENEANGKLTKNSEELKEIKDSLNKFKINEHIKNNETLEGEINDNIDDFNENVLDKLISLIVDKKKDLSKNISCDIKIGDKLSEALNELKKIYENHNKEVYDIETIIETKTEHCKNWVVIALLEDSGEDSYSALKGKLNKYKELLKKKQKELDGAIQTLISNYNNTVGDDKKIIKDNLKDIQDKEEEYDTKLKSTKLAIEDIKNHFKGIINTDITISENEESKMFSIKRNRGKDALDTDALDTLSEGEKTALAFSYFLTTLKSSTSKGLIKDSIIVIDDPISSLDYNVIYNIYNKIYHEVYDRIIIKPENDRNNLVLLTHNWYFANLINNGLNIKDKGKAYLVNRGKVSKFNNVSSYFKNEYDFLLDNILECYRDITSIKDTKMDHIACYYIPNMCRRFLEIYCNFNKKDNIHRFLNNNNNNDVQRFLNMYSHGDIGSDKEPIFKGDDYINFFKKFLKLLKKENNEKLESKLKDIKID